MIGTESRLWQMLRDNVGEHYADAHFARIESPITPGCSDVHYALQPWTGWIELKTASKPRPHKPLSLHSPLTLAQASWLLHHRDTQNYQRSWLLIGLLGPRTWRGFLLVAPVPALKLLKVRKGEPFEDFLLRPEVYPLPTIKDVLKRIKRKTP